MNNIKIVSGTFFKLFLLETKKYIAIFAFLICIKNASAQPEITLLPVITSGLSSPVQLVNAGDASGRIFIVQKGGTVLVFSASYNFLSTFMAISNITTNSERGLLSMVFHPGYRTNGLFYVYFTNSNGDLELKRYHVSTDPNIADTSSGVTLITIPHPVNSNHNGGELHFGNDGFLYLSTGDGGGGGDVNNNAQNTSVLLGKMLRFNVNTSNTPPYYSIPPGNPFGNEIFDLGLRNPFRWSFDRQNFDMWIGDVGQDSWEEIDHRKAGTTANVNYGWHCYEGDSAYNTNGCGVSSDYVFPVFTYRTPDPSGAVTGGLVYRGTTYPAMQGWYLSADFYTGNFYKIAPNGSGGWKIDSQAVSPTGIVDFGETEDAEAYAVSFTGNSVYHITTTSALPLTLVSFTASTVGQQVKLTWHTANEKNTKMYEIEYRTDGHLFNHLASLPSRNALMGSTYTFFQDINFHGAIFYRLKMIDADNKATYSYVLKLVLNSSSRIFIAPSVIENGKMNVYIPGNSNYNFLEIVDMTGTVIRKQKIEQANQFTVSTSGMAKGTYVVRFIGGEGFVTQKILIQ